MKNLIKISGLFFVAILMFSSCKKDELSIKNPELTLGDEKKINTTQDEISISGKIAPEDADTEITLKVTSNEDPIGFEITLTLTEGSYTDADVKYLYKSFATSIYAANHTNATNKKIKVAAGGDVISVKVGDNIISKTITFEGGETIEITYWSSSNSATLFLYGYSFVGTENPQVQAWTGRDNQPIDLTMEYDDPTQYQGLPSFNNYKKNIEFVDSWSNYDNQILGVYPEGDTIFVKYNNKTYYSIYPTNTFEALPEL